MYIHKLILHTILLQNMQIQWNPYLRFLCAALDLTITLRKILNLGNLALIFLPGINEGER